MGLEITYTSWGKLKEEWNFDSIIIEDLNSSRHNVTNYIGHKTNKVLELQEKLIEILYKKGILDDADIKEMVKLLDRVSDSDPFEVTIKEDE